MVTAVPTDAGTPPLLVLVGPTASGKTGLSLELAGRFAGEIVSADSRLFYQGMDIGTAKPSPAERAAIPHHLIDITRPGQTITLGEYQQRAYTTIHAIQQRGRLPILVGGTGQYVKAVVEGWGIPRIPPSPACATPWPNWAATRPPAGCVSWTRPGRPVSIPATPAASSAPWKSP